MRRFATALVLLATASCITVSFDRRRGFEPLDGKALGELRAGRADLAQCLAKLGAPNLVYQQPDGRIAMAWASLDQFGWGMDVSVSLRGVSASGELEIDKRDIEGAVLFFDRELRLVSLERGLLRDFLVQPRRQLPPAVEVD